MSQTIPFTSRKLSRKSCADEAGGLRTTGKGGSWDCKLETRAPLSIKALFAGLKQKGAQAFVPGGSLKGMLRNMVEMLGAGCGSLYAWEDDADSQAHPDLTPCKPDAACIACRLFGFVEGDFSWPGKLRVHDSASGPAAWEFYRISFDREPHEQAGGAGWIVFPCKPLDAIKVAGGGEICVAERQSFTFRLVYQNLDDEEYAVLKFALTLKHGAHPQLLHMLGYAKSLGFGACRISIDNDQSPAIGPEIQPYLADPAFAELTHWRKASNPYQP